METQGFMGCLITEVKSVVSDGASCQAFPGLVSLILPDHRPVENRDVSAGRQTRPRVAAPTLQTYIWDQDVCSDLQPFLTCSPKQTF